MRICRSTTSPGGYPPGVGEDDDLGIWEAEETGRFLRSVVDDGLSALYELAAYAGTRRAELCALRWGDLDPDWFGAWIRQTIVDRQGGRLRASADPPARHVAWCLLAHAVGRRSGRNRPIDGP